MKYISTRGDKKNFFASEVILKGIADDGGLYIPERIPDIDLTMLGVIPSCNYFERAATILELFLPEFKPTEIDQCVERAYGNNKFAVPEVAPVRMVGDKRAVLELWHGPTSAFKDMALQILPHLLSFSLQKTREKSEIVILTATSGDTGKAALAGFANIPQVKVVVFYPNGGVSEVQRLQMVTQQGNNVCVAAVEGNFDTAQAGVKKIFANKDFNARLNEKGKRLSSANSINWGRLLPQIVYYFSAYADLQKSGKIVPSSQVNFVVPTGNFGDILAGYYAKKLGLPINKLICASNTNNVLSDFFATGVYDAKRDFYKTFSPSMDILVSSNLERLLYYVAKGDCEFVAKSMQELAQSGTYDIGKANLKDLQEDFWACWVDELTTLQTIKKVYREHKYMIDPHTAVAWEAGERYREETGDDLMQVVVSTASPFKFNTTVAEALLGDNAASILSGKSEFEILYMLAGHSDSKVPQALSELPFLPVLHNAVCKPDEMESLVSAFCLR